MLSVAFIPQLNTVWRWEMWGGGWSFTGADCQGCPIFPLSIMDVLIFLIIVQLAWRFNGIVLQIAKDIAGASLALNMSGAISEWMNPVKGKMDELNKAGNKGAEKNKGLQDAKDARGGGAPGAGAPLKKFLDQQAPMAGGRDKGGGAGVGAPPPPAGGAAK